MVLRRARTVVVLAAARKMRGMALSSIGARLWLYKAIFWRKGRREGIGRGVRDYD